MGMKWVLMKVMVSQFAFVMPTASQCGSFEVCVSPAGSGIMKYPSKLPVTPAFTTPAGGPFWQAPGLKFVGGESDAGVTKLPSLNYSTTRNVPSGFFLTVKCRSNVSFAQSFPQVPESVDMLLYGP